MPELAGVPQADGLAVFDDVGNDENLGMPGQQELLEHMDLQHAKTTAESDVLFGCDALIAEHHDVIVQVGAVDAGEILVVDGSGQVQANDLGAYGIGEWTDVERLRRDVRGI